MKLTPFEETCFAFQADTSGIGAYANPLYDEAEIQRRVEIYKGVPKVVAIRVAKYRLESVTTVYATKSA